jgi:periplasmic divalent cation tolerance protein
VKHLVVLVTSPEAGVSEKLSKGLVRLKLAACVNRLPGIQSRYWWKGKIETAREELLIIKTRQDRLKRLTQWVKKNHPYSICEVMALPVSEGNDEYLRWIDESLKKPIF